MNLVDLLFSRRVRGFRVIELAALGCLAVLVLGVYAFKAGAGRESARIGDVDRQIADERRRVRLLRAEISHLEQPARLERLSSTYLGMAPLQAPREAPVDGLAELAHQTSAVPAAGPAHPAETVR